jgi:alcohol dehydrogenase
MRAAVMTEHQEPLEVKKVEYPEVEDDGIIIDVQACGICRSDWHNWQGHWTWVGLEEDVKADEQIMGHESAGNVVEVGENVEHVEVGDRIAVPYHISDGTCEWCRKGHSNRCENGVTMGETKHVQGAFAEYVHVPNADHNAVHLPEELSFEDVAGLGCRFMTAFHGLSHRAEVSGGDWVAIHGCGGVGLSGVQIGNSLGANVIAVDIQDEKLEMAEEFGATATINGMETDDVPGKIKEITDGGADVSVDALGVEETCRNSVDCLGVLGKHVQIGLTTGEEEGEIPIPTDEMLTKEQEFITSAGMPHSRYDEIFNMVATNKVDPGAIISERTDLEGITDVLDRMTDFEVEGIAVVTEF